jgi:uncharacterized protein
MSDSPPIESAGAIELSPAGLVTDGAAILSDEEEEALKEKLADVAAKTGHLVLVVTVPSLNGEDVVTYTENLANRWGVGRESGYDGVVLLLAMRERRARIAIGRGLIGELPDAHAQQILDETIIPRFREGDLYGGIDAGLVAIIAVLKGDQS